MRGHVQFMLIRNLTSPTVLAAGPMIGNDIHNEPTSGHLGLHADQQYVDLGSMGVGGWGDGLQLSCMSAHAVCMGGWLATIQQYVDLGSKRGGAFGCRETASIRVDDCVTMPLHAHVHAQTCMQACI